MDDASYIIGLMKTETVALGFIPSPTIRDRFVRRGLYVIQRDARGRRRGYLLHGPPKPGRRLHIHQACIDYDYRQRGFGILAVRTVIMRALQADCSAVTLRCALDLPANAFWHAAGFEVEEVLPGGKQRHRVILRYVLPLAGASTRLVVPGLYPLGPLAATDPGRVARAAAEGTGG